MVQRRNAPSHEHKHQQARQQENHRIGNGKKSNRTSYRSPQPGRRRGIQHHHLVPHLQRCRINDPHPMHSHGAILSIAHLQVEEGFSALAQRRISSTQISCAPQQRIFLPHLVEIVLRGLHPCDIQQHAVGVIRRLHDRSHQRVGMPSQSDIQSFKERMPFVEIHEGCRGHCEQQLDQQHKRDYPARHGVPSHESLPTSSGSSRYPRPRRVSIEATPRPASSFRRRFEMCASITFE